MSSVLYVILIIIVVFLALPWIGALAVAYFEWVEKVLKKKGF